MGSVLDVRARATVALCLALLLASPAAAAGLALASTRSDAEVAELGAGFDRWLDQALAQAGLEADPLESSSAEHLVEAAAEGLDKALLPQLEEHAGQITVRFVLLDPANGALIQRASAKAPLAATERAIGAALEQLGDALGARLELAPPQLAELASLGRAEAHQREGRLFAAWNAIESVEAPSAATLRDALIQRARKGGDSDAERTRLLAASGAPDDAWMVLGSRANLEVNKPRPDPQLLVAAGDVQLARGNPRSAMRFLEVAVRVAPDSLEVQLAIARARLMQNNAEAARESLAYAEQIAPDDPRLPALLSQVDAKSPKALARHELASGRIAARLLDPDRARAHWQRASELDAALRGRAALERARLESRLGRPAESLEAYHEATEAGEKGPEVWTGLGSAQASLGKNQEAETSLRRAVDLDPDHRPALTELGALLTETDRVEEAVPVLQRAHHLEPANTPNQLILARALRLSGQGTDAMEVLLTGGDSDDVRILRELAASQSEAGDAAAAQESLSRAVSLRPYDAELRETYALALESGGDAAAAERERAFGLVGAATEADEAPSAAEAGAETGEAGVAVDFDGLIATFTTALKRPQYSAVVVLPLREPGDPRTWLRRLTRLREVDTHRVQAGLQAAVKGRFRLVPIGDEDLATLSESIEPLYDFDVLESRSAENVARINTVLDLDGIFITRLISHPQDHEKVQCLEGTFALETRLLTGNEAPFVNILTASDCVAGGLDLYGRWNAEGLAGLAALLAFLIYPAVRGWGTLVVRIHLPDKTKGFFSIFITKSPNQVRKEIVDKKTGREKLVARRSFDILRRFRKHMAGREETFKLIPARRTDYTVTVGGPLLDARGDKIVGHFLEEQQARVRRRFRTELDFDFRPRECAVEVRVQYQGRPAEGAQVAVAGDPTSLRYAREGQAFLYLGKGEHIIRVGNKDAAGEFRVLIESYENAVPLQVDLADCDALFRDCPDAVEPFLLGDLASAIDALEASGGEAAHRLRAEMLEQSGHAGDAANELEAAGRLREAATLRASDSDHSASANLYLQAGDYANAAQSYRSAGRFDEAAQAFEEVYDYGNALECWREAGNTEREIDMLDKLGEYFDAAELSRGMGEMERAIRYLQLIEPRHPQHIHACRMIAEIVAQKGDYELAVAKYEESFADLGTEGAALETLESFAQVLERADRREEALSVWEAIRRRDVERHDVGTRIQALRSELEGLTRATAVPGAEAAAKPAEARYELLEEIGRGGMGVVYKARDKRLGRIVALKRLPENMRQHPAAVQLFEREARAAAALNHRNIVTLFDAGEEDGAYFITMELLEGRPLDEILKRSGRLSSRDTARIGLQVAAGLHYAHAQRIVHRDIKTSNLFFTRDQVVKIMDFGIAKSMEEVRRSTTIVGGTPYYMAPEQATGEGVDHRADLYALGVTLFQLCTGTLPFSSGDVTYQHAHASPPDPRELEMNLPEALATLILQLMAKQPGERPDTAAEVAEVLRGLLE